MLKEMSLFVYGSLCEGMVHFNKINDYVVSKSKAWAKGEVYRLPSGYPAFLLKENGTADLVAGELVQLQAPDLVYTILDEFHGYSVLMPEKSLFFKTNIEVEVEVGSAEGAAADGARKVMLATTYVMNRNKLPKHAQIISQGDWQKNLQEQPPLTHLLTERQATYIKKLNTSSGRDIVPIDLDLYRELMKLELIVDKGRRLALSKLGKEVANYLPQ